MDTKKIHQYQMDHTLFIKNNITFENGIAMNLNDYRNTMRSYGDKREEKFGKYKSSFIRCLEKKLFFQFNGFFFTALKPNIASLFPNSYSSSMVDIFKEEMKETEYLKKDERKSPRKILKTLQKLWENEIKFQEKIDNSQPRSLRIFEKLCNLNQIKEFLSLNPQDYPDNWQTGTIDINSINEFTSQNNLF